MTRQITWMVAALVAVVLQSDGELRAQPPAGFGSRPGYSPYLNLTRPGSSVTQNYYGLVRPEVQARQSVQNLQGSVAADQLAIGGLQNGSPPELPITGHQSSFLNYRSYFLSSGVGGAGMGGGTSFRASGVQGAPGRR